MKSRTLVFDIGNSNIVIGLCDPKRILKSWRIPTRTQAIQRWARIFPKPIKIDKICVSNVVPEMKDTLLTLKKTFKTPVLFLTYKNFSSLKVKVKNPSRIGVDRLVNAVAAQKLFPKKNLLVIDMGTATTMDVITSSGDFLGGLITPGPHTINQALFERCSQLPLLPIEKPRRPVGKDTKSAIQSGIFYGYLSLLEGLIDKIEAELGQKLTIILTGGPSPLFKTHLKKYTVHHCPKLTLQGLLLSSSLLGEDR